MHNNGHCCPCTVHDRTCKFDPAIKTRHLTRVDRIRSAFRICTKLVPWITLSIIFLRLGKDFAVLSLRDAVGNKTRVSVNCTASQFAHGNLLSQLRNKREIDLRTMKNSVAALKDWQ